MVEGYEIQGRQELISGCRPGTHPSSLISQLFQKHFNTLADTPEAVAKLRKFVLQLAVRGE